MNSIHGFKNQYFFLSNFYDNKITYNNITFKNNEAAFQSQKTKSLLQQKQFANLLPNEAKRLGKQVSLRSDWESIKDNVMYEICKIKFSNPELKQKLLDTGNLELINDNTSEGKNTLGKILMKIRSEIIEENKPKKSKKDKEEKNKEEMD